MTQNWFTSASVVKKIILKTQDGGQPIRLRCIIVTYILSRFFDVKMAAVRHRGFLKLKFLTALHIRDMFPITCQILWRLVMSFQKCCDFVLVKYTNSLDDCAQYGMNLSRF